jgi:ribosomal protein S18 acetylase RimI-like enzyme
VTVDESDVAVGFLLADIVDGNFHIKEMDVHPDHGRKGLGTKLLHCAEKCRLTILQADV